MAKNNYVNIFSMASCRTRFYPRFTGKKARLAAAGLLLAALAFTGSAGCAPVDEPLTTPTAKKAVAVPHKRLPVSFFKGVVEPRSDDLQSLVLDAEQILGDGFNIVGMEPPVLINQRAGGSPRVILAGASLTVSGQISSIHEKGLAVFLAPTTASPGFSERVPVDEHTLEALTEDVLSWAEQAEQEQVELFAPLSRCNLALGTSATDRWLRDILPQVRQRYKGPVVAKVVVDIDAPPDPGEGHDFELLHYQGYDYLMIDLGPMEPDQTYDQESVLAYSRQVIARAEAVVRRDRLKGLIIGDLRLPRTESTAELSAQTAVGETNQAMTADAVLAMVMPRVDGVFYLGWSLREYGAHGFWVEDVLARHFGGAAAADGAAASGATATGITTVAEDATATP